MDKEKKVDTTEGFAKVEKPFDYMEYLIKSMEINKKSLEAEKIEEQIKCLQSQINTLATELLCQKAKIDVFQSVIGK